MVPDDLHAALDAAPPADANWEAYPPSESLERYFTTVPSAFSTYHLPPTPCPATSPAALSPAK